MANDKNEQQKSPTGPARTSHRGDQLDERLEKSAKSPNELDGSDEAEKADDITQAGKQKK